MPTSFKTIQIAVHIVRTSNRTGGLSNNNIDLAFAQLNATYFNSLLRFIKVSTDYIDSDTYYNIETDSEFLNLITVNNVQNVINVYFIGGTFFARGKAEWIPSYNLVVQNIYATSKNVFAHEVGHCLDLWHTHEFETFGKEYVPRTPPDDESCTVNCSTSGDLLCDTPAERDLTGNVNSNCEYDPIIAEYDSCGNPYEPNTTNIMSYSDACRSTLTTQQTKRMHYAIENKMSNLLSGTSITLQNKIGGSVITGTTLSVNNTSINSNETINLISNTTSVVSGYKLNRFN